MNLHPKLYLALAALGIVLVTAAYYEWREPLPFDEKNPVSMKAPNIRAHAKRGNPDAQFALGSLYAHGDKWQGIPEDANQAEEWLKKAASAGHALSAYTLAETLQHSHPQEAEKYYLEAIEKGFPPAFFGYGQFKLREGKDIPIALSYIHAGANANDPNAQAFLATLLHDGLGLKKDPVGAILWLQKAAVNAPSPSQKQEWTNRQQSWVSDLTPTESEKLSEQLMTGALAPGESAPSGLQPSNGPIDPALVLPQ